MMLSPFIRLTLKQHPFRNHATLYTWIKINHTTLITTTSTFQVKRGTTTNMLLTIDETARMKLQSLHATYSNKFLRILVEGGGCHGYQYVYKLDDKFDEGEDVGIVSAPNIIESSLEGELRVEKEEKQDMPSLIPPPIHVMPVVIDRMSLELLLDSKLIYEQDVMGEQFAIIDNPIADKGCGCGVSFGIKEHAQV